MAKKININNYKDRMTSPVGLKFDTPIHKPKVGAANVKPTVKKTSKKA